MRYLVYSILCYIIVNLIVMPNVAIANIECVTVKMENVFQPSRHTVLVILCYQVHTQLVVENGSRSGNVFARGGLTSLNYFLGIDEYI